MRKINYKMIVSDFDGTLVQGDGKVSEKNIKAINEYIDAGGVFVISTGRVCVQLASPDFKYMNGETLTLEGGMGLRP